MENAPGTVAEGCRAHRIHADETDGPVAYKRVEEAAPAPIPPTVAKIAFGS